MNDFSFKIDDSADSFLEEFFDFNMASGPSEAEGVQPGRYDYHDNPDFEINNLILIVVP